MLLAVQTLHSLQCRVGSAVDWQPSSDPDMVRANMSQKALQEPQHNHLLAALKPAVQGRLYPHLKLVRLPLRTTLGESGCALQHLYFPTDSIISLQYVTEDGESSAISLVGNEGLLGVSVCLGGDAAPSRMLVQSAGYAYRLPVAKVKDEFGRHGQLLLLMLRFTQALIAQVGQTAACNRHHTIEQRLCRWLLLSVDRSQTNQLTMTHEYVGQMLGARREGVTEAASRLRQMGVITYSRGSVRVINRSKLESLSCECYGSVRKETDRLLGEYSGHSPNSSVSTSRRPVVAASGALSARPGWL